MAEFDVWSGGSISHLSKEKEKRNKRKPQTNKVYICKSFLILK
jgi:hypothetical protein